MADIIQIKDFARPVLDNEAAEPDACVEVRFAAVVQACEIVFDGLLGILRTLEAAENAAEPDRPLLPAAPPTGDARTSVRAYKRAWETSEALRWLFERPHHFDARLTLKLASFL